MDAYDSGLVYEQRKALIKISSVVENAPYVIEKGCSPQGAGNSKGSSNSSSHSSNSSSHSSSRAAVKILEDKL